MAKQALAPERKYLLYALRTCRDRERSAVGMVGTVGTVGTQDLTTLPLPPPMGHTSLPPVPVAPSGEDSGCSPTGWAGRQADRQTDGRTDSRTDSRRGAWPRYLEPSPVRGDGGGGCVTAALVFQLPEEPAGLVGARGGDSDTHTEREGAREAGGKDGTRGKGMSLVPPQDTRCPRSPHRVQPSPSSPARTPG